MAKSLTAAAVEKLKADPGKRLEIPDGLLPGLFLVVQPSGRKSWAVRYRAHAKPVKFTIGAYPAFGLAEAREAARDALRRVQTGDDPAAAKRHDRETADMRQFGAIARNFVVRYTKPKNRRWRDAARLIGLDVTAKQPDPMEADAIPGSALAKWGGRQIGKIGRADVVDLLDRIADRGAPVTANRVLAALKTLFGWAVERGSLDKSPCDGLKLPAVETPRKRVLDDDEIAGFWGACDAIDWPFGPLAKLLLLTGQRLREVAEMRWAEVDGDVWSIPGARVKNGKLHVVPLSPAAAAILAELPRMKDCAFVFSTNGRTPVSGFSNAKQAIDRHMLAAMRKRAIEAGGDAQAVELKPWTYHDLRRTAATGMARAGADIAVVERALNHTSGTFAGIVGTYQLFDFADERRRALTAWADLVARTVDGAAPGNVIELAAVAAKGGVR